MRDYYEILGVAREADADAIKKAYRKLAFEFHPDRNSGAKDAEDRFREATEAYEVLRDAEKRSAYDRYGHAGVKGAAGAGAGFGGFDFADALNIFMRDFGGFNMEDVFAGRSGRGRRGPRRGTDAQIRVPLTLQEVAAGVRKTVRVSLQDLCEKCSGTGSADGSAPVACGTCGGAGEVRRVQRSILGQLVSVAPCPTCGGEGTRVEQPCTRCEGDGLARSEKTLDVDVPAGVSSGDYITLRGRGNAGARGAAPGDLIVVLEVEDDPRFVRDGADLICERTITFTQAALGAEVDVPVVDGEIRLKIPAGTQSGRLFRLRGRGLPHLQANGRGDLLVRVTVWIPTQLTGEQEKQLKKLAELETAPPQGSHPEGEERGFWSKVKEAFTV